MAFQQGISFESQIKGHVDTFSGSVATLEHIRSVIFLFLMTFNLLLICCLVCTARTRTCTRPCPVQGRLHGRIHVHAPNTASTGRVDGLYGPCTGRLRVYDRVHDRVHSPYTRAVYAHGRVHGP